MNDISMIYYATYWWNAGASIRAQIWSSSTVAHEATNIAKYIDAAARAQMKVSVPTMEGGNLTVPR